MINRLSGAFPGEPVQSPKQDYIKFLLMSINEKLSELWPLTGAARHTINILPINLIPILSAILVELPNLVVHFLFVLGAYATIYSNYHLAASTGGFLSAKAELSL